MAKRIMTNTEKLTHMMDFSKHGALKQCFIMEAIHKYADACAAATPEQVGTAFISGEAWVAVAKEVQKELAEQHTINDLDLDDEDDYPHDEDDGLSDMDFANPGSNSALRAATPSNQRNLPCPTCESPNRLTPADVRQGYQCDRCADAMERGIDIGG